jgi:hypothetical protein
VPGPLARKKQHLGSAFVLAPQVSVLPGRHQIFFWQSPQPATRFPRRILEPDQRCVVHLAAIHPHVAVAHQCLDHIEPIRLAKYSYDLTAVAVGVDDINEHVAVRDHVDQRRTSGVAVGLAFLWRIDVLKTNIDVAFSIASLSRPYQKAVAVEDPADGPGEVAIIRARGSHPAQRRAGDQQPMSASKLHRMTLRVRVYSG